MEIFVFLRDMNPCIAIIDQNTLSNITLRSILWDLYNKVEVLIYGSMDSFIRDSNRHFIHFFVSSDIFFTHVDEFDFLRNQTTVLCIGPNRRYEAAGFKVLDISLPEQELILQRSELGEDLSFQVLRPRENDPEKPERIFACWLEF